MKRKISRFIAVKFKFDEKEEEDNSKTKKGGIPGWVWAVGGLQDRFFAHRTFFSRGLFFLFLNKTGFEVVLTCPSSKWIRLMVQIGRDI